MENDRYSITVLESGETFWCASDETVLSAMMRARCGPVHYGCCGGGCGICKMRIVSGEYDAIKRMSRAHIDLAQEPDMVLLCCIQPRSDLTITGD